MKKLKFLSLLIAFLLGGLLYPIYSKASAVPTTHTLTVMENTVEQLFNFGFVPQSLMPYGDISTNTWDAWQTGGVLLNFDLTDCEITELNSSQKSDLLSNWTIVNTSNINVTTNDKIYSVKMDNGYFTGYVYVDENGNILSYTNDLGGQLLQVKYGGSIKTSDDWKNLYESTATQIYDANFNLYDNPSLIQGDTSYYYFIGQDYASYPYVAQELYIANQYQPGVVVPVKISDGSHIGAWYTNNLDLFNYKMVYGDDNRWKAFKVYPGTYRQDNVSYTYQVNYSGYISNKNTYQNWLNGNGNLTCNFANYGTEYSSTLYNNASSSVAFKPLQLPEGSQVINYNYYYDYDAIQRLETQLNNLTQQLNSQFNNQNQLSENNFPFYYPANNLSIDASELPFSQPVTPPVSNPNVNPEINNPYEDLDPSSINDTIPIISGLQNKFPFSIPWDIYNLLHGLEVPREIPVLNFEIEIPVIDYTWTPSIDLTMYDGTAELFRTLFLIIFIIGLAVFSYNHFFGS